MNTERQVQIIDISMKLIANNGIQGFTIKNLSKEIGFSEPAIYRHFKSKTDILLAILKNFKEMGEMMTSMLENNNDTAIEKINFLFTSMISVFSEEPAIISVIFSEEIFKNDIILKNKIIEIQNMYQLNIESIVEKGQKENNLRTDIDKVSLALILMGSLRLLVKRWDLNSHNIDLEIEGQKLIKSFKLLLNK